MIFRFYKEFEEENILIGLGEQEKLVLYIKFIEDKILDYKRDNDKN